MGKVVRAKVYCAAKTETANQGSTTKSASIILYPVISGSEENKKFYQYTPGGKLELNVLLPETSDAFVLGKQYYVDFTPEDDE